jgi:hypothetical protein
MRPPNLRFALIAAPATSDKQTATKVIPFLLNQQDEIVVATFLLKNFLLCLREFVDG